MSVKKLREKAKEYRAAAADIAFSNQGYPYLAAALVLEALADAAPICAYDKADK